MDPNETLKSILHSLSEGAGTELVDDVEALDDWIMKGGFLPKKWEEKCNGGLLKRAIVAKSVYEAWAGSFAGGKVTGAGPTHVLIGNLMGSLLTGGRFVVPWYPPSMREEFLRLFPDGHPVWEFITLEEDEGV